MKKSTSWHSRWRTELSRSLNKLSLICILLVSVCTLLTDSSDFHTIKGALEIDDSNINTAIESAEFTFINFYANWCRFSQILEPVFNDLSDKVKEEFTTEGSVILGKVDCDKNPSIASRYHISKYPTLKMFRNGEIQKREYRGQRSVDALQAFVREQLKDPVREFTSEDEMAADGHAKKRKVIGFFDVKDSEDYKNFKKLASTFRSDCEFWSGFGEASAPERPGGNRIVYRDPKSAGDVVFPAELTNYQLLFQWAQDKCIPLVREITFENAEELTEEGIPFLILFHKPDDTSNVDEYNRIIATELLHERHSINFLTADGLRFAHPLHHLGKSQSDLPLIAIDSFRHMYLFPKYEDIRSSGRLKQFVADLHSGKLHREFHQGPDTTTPAPPPPSDDDGDDSDGDDDDDNQPSDTQHQQRQQDVIEQQQAGAAKTSPPESTFRKLAPSKTRYTLLRDEL